MSVNILQYSVKIDAFEGPLDLLLHLIKKMEIDIYDIPVAEITEQYMLYIREMTELELDIASEYLVMAATLIAIKSRSLLPNTNMEDEDESEFQAEDPLEELVQQLVEYKRYKEITEEFQVLEAERALIFTKAPVDLSEYSTDSSPGFVSGEGDIYEMLTAFRKLLRRQKLQKPVQTTLKRQTISVEQRMAEVVDQIRGAKGKTLFTSLFARYDRTHLVITFLAILELMKLHRIFVEQERNLDDITIYLKDEVI